MVKAVFSSVAESYDRMNDAMSLGIHRLWKRRFIRGINPRPGQTILDMAGGTGDIAFLLYKAMGGKADITVADINPDMLAVGRDRAVEYGIADGDLKWQEVDAETLPFEDNSFDLYTIAFGLRNVTHIDKALSEAYRVLKPGGKFYCLEFSQVNAPGLKHIYDFYSFNIIPKLGEVIAQDRQSYQYLVESIRRFPSQDKLSLYMKRSGFEKTSYENLSAGIAAIHSGVKI